MSGFIEYVMHWLVVIHIELYVLVVYLKGYEIGVKTWLKKLCLL